MHPTREAERRDRNRGPEDLRDRVPLDPVEAGAFAVDERDDPLRADSVRRAQTGDVVVGDGEPSGLRAGASAGVGSGAGARDRGARHVVASGEVRGDCGIVVRSPGVAGHAEVHCLSTPHSDVGSPLCLVACVRQVISIGSGPAEV
jgi:hypothetical protein